MSKEEKLDMLAHEFIEEEAQMMAFFIENEYGLEQNFVQMEMQGMSQCQLDSDFENALNHVTFKKYLAQTRLQATLHARQYTEKRLQASRNEDKELIEYASYLKDQLENLDNTNAAIKISLMN